MVHGEPAREFGGRRPFAPAADFEDEGPENIASGPFPERFDLGNEDPGQSDQTLFPHRSGGGRGPGLGDGAGGSSRASGAASGAGGRGVCSSFAGLGSLRAGDCRRVCGAGRGAFGSGSSGGSSRPSPVWSFPRRARVRRPTPAKISAAAFPPSFNCPPNRRTAPPSFPSFLPALPIRPSDVRRARAPRVTAPPISRTALPARVAARPARSPSVAIRRSFFAAGPACCFRNRYVSANPERIQRTQSRTPRSHGRGFRIQARIASRPGGVSSSGS